MAGSTRLRRTGWEAAAFLAVEGLARVVVDRAGNGAFVDAIAKRIDRRLGEWMSETGRTTDVEGAAGPD